MSRAIRINILSGLKWDIVKTVNGTKMESERETKLKLPYFKVCGNVCFLYGTE